MRARKKPTRKLRRRFRQLSALLDGMTFLRTTGKSKAQKRAPRPPGAEQYTSEEYRPYVLAIGQVALAWNDLHEVLCEFYMALTSDFHEPTLAAWQAVPSDRTKRAMLKAALNAALEDYLPYNPHAPQDWKWLLGQIDRLEDDRNNVVHAPLASFQSDVWRDLGVDTGIKPDAVCNNRRATNLIGRGDLLIEYRWVRDAIIGLRDYTEALADAWRVSSKRPAAWPERPRLPNRGQKSRRAEPQKAPANQETKPSQPRLV